MNVGASPTAMASNQLVVGSSPIGGFNMERSHSRSSAAGC